MIPSWFEEALSDPQITDFCVNGSRGAFFDRGKGLEEIEIPSEKRLSDEQLRNWVLHALSLAGKTWDAKFPFVDATLPSGHRLHVAFPPLARQGFLVSLRRLPKPGARRSASQELGTTERWQEKKYFRFLSEAVRKGDSIIISGSTGSGKTTLAGDLLEEVGENERILALEDTPELNPSHPHFVSMISRPPNADGYGEVSLKVLLKQALRMRPDRIILGECRGGEVLDLLQALNTGHKGSLATLHSNSPRDALRRIELLCLLYGGGAIPITAIRELLSLGIQWIVQVKREGALRHIKEVWKIEGREGDTILMRPVLESQL